MSDDVVKCYFCGRTQGHIYKNFPVNRLVNGLIPIELKGKTKVDICDTCIE